MWERTDCVVIAGTKFTRQTDNKENTLRAENIVEVKGYQLTWKQHVQ
jgi:hypothetical protein